MDGTTRRSVLVIEDDTDIRELMDTVLQRAGYIVHQSPNGRDGIAAARRLQPDVITCDVRLPDVPGYDVARELRAVTEAPILMVSGSSSLVDDLAGLAIGRCAALIKPFYPRELCERVDDVLSVGVG